MKTKRERRKPKEDAPAIVTQVQVYSGSASASRDDYPDLFIRCNITAWTDHCGPNPAVRCVPEREIRHRVEKALSRIPWRRYFHTSASASASGSASGSASASAS
jgi:hypothetical protein